MTTGNPNLRAELTRLTAAPPGVGLEWLGAQIREIEALRVKLPHSVRLHTRFTPAIYDLNCFMHALDIDAEAVQEMRLGDIFPGQQFVRSLLAGAGLRALKSADNPSDGSIVIYLDGSGPRHAGRSTTSSVVSKWGAGGTHIWEHALWDVPDTYGDEARFFMPLPDATEIYLEWAAAHGL